MTSFPRRGLYAITAVAADQPVEQVIDRARAALSGGAVMLQYRDKTSPLSRRTELASGLVALCRNHHAPLIINDDVDLALEVGADGVHLGREDPDPRIARRLLGDQAIIGVSCYNNLQRAERAVAQGATYVAFGRFFPSHTKPGATPADVEVLRNAKAHFATPVAAIGGITPENAPQLVRAGADFVAVVSGVFLAPDPRAAARRFAQLFTSA